MMTSLMLLLSTFILYKQSLSIPILLTSSLVLTITYTWNTHTINPWITTDNLSLTLISLTLYIMLLIITASDKSPITTNLLILSTIILILAFSFNDLILFYISFELILIPMFLIITAKGKQPERLQASLFILLYTVTASLPLLISIILMNPLNSFLQLLTSNYQSPNPVFLILAFLVKMPMFLTHLWLPKAHVEAPFEGSMILAAILLKLGGYGVLRITPSLYAQNHLMNNWIMSISLLGASLTGLNCIRQKDIKAIIALSSVAHMALVISSLMSMNPYGIKGAYIMMIGHGLASSALFLIINYFYILKGTRNTLLLKGNKTHLPNLTLWMFLFLAANISAPPTLNIISEIFMFTSLTRWSLFSIPLILTSFMMTSTFSMLLFSLTFHNQPDPTPTPPSINAKANILLSAHIIPLLILPFKMEALFLM